jgi:guanylate kinase
VIPKVVILSAPSGGGKTTIARTLAARRGDVGISVSATTRAPRPGERDGEAYHFVSRDAFRMRVAAGEFLEWAEYAGELYGTPRGEVDRIRTAGRHVLLDIEVHGAGGARGAGRRRDRCSAPPDGTPGWRAAGAAVGWAPRCAPVRRRGGEIAAAAEYEQYGNDDLERAVAEVARITTEDARPAPGRERRTLELRHVALAAGGAEEDVS